VRFLRIDRPSALFTAFAAQSTEGEAIGLKSAVVDSRSASGLRFAAVDAGRVKTPRSKRLVRHDRLNTIGGAGPVALRESRAPPRYVADTVYMGPVIHDNRIGDRQ